MNYATWKLNFANSDYGTGPEDLAVSLGYAAESSWVEGEVEKGGTILGYVSKALNESKFTAWELQNLSQKEALDFCLAINETAYLLPDGRITTPREI